MRDKSITRQCINCKSTFTRQSHEAYNRFIKRTYCSQSCYRKGITPEMRELMATNARRNIAKETPEHRQLRMVNVLAARKLNGVWKSHRLGKRGAEVNGVWLDNEATYNAKHRWIQQRWPKTGKCEDCGKRPRPFGRRKYGTEWANLDGQYDRNNRTTWRELCVACHRLLDNK